MDKCKNNETKHCLLHWYSVAEAVQMFCNSARQHHIEKWVLVIPLIHLLRGESKPFEPVPPVLNPQFDSWTGLRGSKGTHVSRDGNIRYGVFFLLKRLEYTYIPFLNIWIKCLNKTAKTVLSVALNNSKRCYSILL